MKRERKDTLAQEEWWFQEIYYMQLPVCSSQTPVWEHLYLFPLTNVKTVIFTCLLPFFHEWPLLPSCWLPSSSHSINGILYTILTETPGMTGRLVDSLWFPVFLSNFHLNLPVTQPAKANADCLAVSEST
jgi:hypothetical protein